MSEMMKRRSVRSYTDQEVPQEVLKTLVRAAQQAPSAGNQQPWEFIIVDDRNTLDALSVTSKGAWMLKNARAAIVIVMTNTTYSPKMRPQDCAAATQNILLEAVHQGLGAVWIGVYPLNERITHVSSVLNINEEAQPFSIISIGYSIEEKEVVPRYDESRIHYNHWSK